MRMRAKSIDKVRRLDEAIGWAEIELEKAGVYFGHGTDNARDEAAWLVAAAAGVAPIELRHHASDSLEAESRARLRTLVRERIDTRKPTAYLLKEAWFGGLRFYVDERVIVPRSLTVEFIAERFRPWIRASKVHRVLDLCTGSACMAILAARAFPDAAVDAIDISDDALAVARINVERHALAARVRVLRSDLYAALGDARYDVILTNPPYVARRELARLPPEYRFEPALALEAGADGLDVILRILAGAAAHLNADGILIAEVGNARGALERTLPSVPFTWLATSGGDESVFLLTSQQLTQQAHSLTAAATPRECR
jgi:ribosomal protein L3 glutamine methyltransferase